MIDHISASQLDIFLQCGEKWKKIYLEHLEDPKPPSVLQGAGVHRTQAYLLRGDLRGEYVPLSVAKDVFDHFWETQKDQYFWDSQTRPKEGKLKDEGYQLVELDYTQTLPAIRKKGEIASVEERWQISLGAGNPKLIGEIDYTLQKRNIDDPEAWGRLVIGELKTVSQRPSNIARERQQLSCYVWIKQSSTDQVEKIECQLDYLYLIKNKTPIYCRMPVEISSRDLSALANCTTQMISSIYSGVFLPAPAGAWWCSRDWCTFYENCKERI